MSTPAVPETVQRLWLAQLRTDWRTFNRDYVDGRLRPPQLELDGSSLRLGSWEPVTRTIRLATSHLLRDTWAEVRLTLRHEMAHQVVSELFHAEAAPPHGRLFDRACRLLDLEHSPRRPSDPDPASSRMLDRVRKLLSLATSTNSHEAQAATAAANRLLLKYNLSRSELSDPARAGFRYRWLGDPLGRIPLERKLLAGILQAHFFVRTLWLGTRRARDNKPVSQLEAMGQPHNLDIADYVHDYLIATVDRLWAGYRRSIPPRVARRARHDYRVGVMMGFGEHLAAQQHSRSEEGLIWLGDHVLDELFAERHPHTTRLRGGTYRDGRAHAVGRRDGRRIRIRSGLDAEPESRGRLLD